MCLHPDTLEFVRLGRQSPCRLWNEMKLYTYVAEWCVGIYQNNTESIEGTITFEEKV